MKKIDYLGLNVEFCNHLDYITEQKDLTKNKELQGVDQMIYRINEGEWKFEGIQLTDFTGFLYTHKAPEDLLKSYNTNLNLINIANYNE